MLFFNSFFRLTIILSHVFITVSLCDVRLSHLNKDYLLTYLRTAHPEKRGLALNAVKTCFGGNLDRITDYCSKQNITYYVLHNLYEMQMVSK